jgi:hypothetical protein
MKKRREVVKVEFFINGSQFSRKFYYYDDQHLYEDSNGLLMASARASDIENESIFREYKLRVSHQQEFSCDPPLLVEGVDFTSGEISEKIVILRREYKVVLNNKNVFIDNNERLRFRKRKYKKRKKKEDIKKNTFWDIVEV